MSEDPNQFHQNIPSAMRWIVENHYPMHPKERRHTVRIQIGIDVISENEIEPNEDLVNITTSDITFWFRPYSQPGAPNFAGVKLNGLFDFLRVVIWPKMIDEWCVERFMVEPNLSEVERAAICRYQALKAEGKRLNLADIENLLKTHPHLQRLYAAIQNKNLSELRECEKYFAREPSQINVEYIREFSNAIEERNTANADSQKMYLLFLIMTAASEMLPYEEQFNFHSPEYEENSANASEQFEHLNGLAIQWSLGAFERLCLAEQMININSLFDSDIDDYKYRVKEFISSEDATRVARR